MGLRPKRAGEGFYKTAQWKAVRKLAKDRDGWRCVKCGARGRLEVDHIKPIRSAPELVFDLDNLQTLCVPCHSKKTREEIFGPMDPEREKWRFLLGNGF